MNNHNPVKFDLSIIKELHLQLFDSPVFLIKIF